MSDVNFTPNRGAYTELTPFRYWCQKVLPLVYDDSISYYELLCKVVNYLNITMEDVSTLNDDVTAMYTAYDELQDFVNQYFTDLNVQTQIDNKLDRMAADGSLNALIDPLVIDTTETSVANTLPGVVEDQLPDVVEDQIDDVVGEQINGVVADQIQGAANNWLNANITGSNALDSTLKLYDAAARSFSAGNLIDTYASYLGAENRITTFASGFWENDNGVMVHPSEPNLFYQSAAITVTAGDKYTIIAPAFTDVYNGVPRYAFTDSSYNVISASDAAAQGAINKTITVPAGATKLIVNDNLVEYTTDARISKMILVKGELTGTNEISNLKADLSDVKNALQTTGTITAKLDQGTLVSGESVKSTTGADQETTRYSRTDYLELPNVSSIVMKQDVTGTINAICFYNASKVFLSGKTSPLSFASIDIPSGAKYAKYSGVTSAMPSTYIEYQADTLIRELQDNITELQDNKANQMNQFDTKYVKENVLLQRISDVSKFPNNLVMYEECTNNGYINVNNGSIASNQPNYFYTGFIAVTAGTTYKANKGRNHIWYKSDKTYLSGETGTSIQSGITAPENAAYIRFNVNKSTDGISDPSNLYFTELANYQSETVISDLVVTKVLPWCYGKKINWIGDSIVDGPDFDEETCSALGLIKSSEYGINGSTIALKADGTDGRNALCIRYSQMSNDADIIAVSCGTNDFEYAWCPIGTIDDADDGTSNNTFYGALKALCKGLIDKYPQKVIFFTTPIKRGQPFENGNGGEYTADGVMTTPFSKNKYGKTLGDYADIIKEVCGYYSIPVLDMYRECLLNPSIASQQNMFDNVYTHPNVTGQKIMARRVCGWLAQLGYTINGLT